MRRTLTLISKVILLGCIVSACGPEAPRRPAPPAPAERFDPFGDPDPTRQVVPPSGDVVAGSMDEIPAGSTAIRSKQATFLVSLSAETPNCEIAEGTVLVLTELALESAHGQSSVGFRKLPSCGLQKANVLKGHFELVTP